ncbi:MAG: tetratricopeptide repeat protein [Gemmataceae bacterium]
MGLSSHFYSGRHSRRLLAIGLLVVMASAGAGWYFWPWQKAIGPPAIDQTQADQDVAAAIESARKEVRQSPRSGAAWGKLGQVFAAHNYDSEAITCFAQAEELDPKEARWPYMHGLTLLFSDGDSAIAHFQRAVILQGNSPAIRLRLAEALLAQARLNEAEEQFQHLLTLEPGSARGYLGLGRIAYLRGDLPSSRQLLRKAASSPMTKKASHTLLAELAQRANDADEAARERRLAAELPNDQDWYDPLVDEIEQMRAGKQARLDYALKQIRQNNSAEGRLLLRKLMADYPDWSAVWLSQGRILLEIHNYLDAEDALRRALRLAPDSVEVNFYLGLALFQQGDFSAAREFFEHATRLKPDYALAYYNLGHCWKRLGNQSSALDAFREAVRCKPSYAAAHANLGELFANQGDKTQALKHLRLAVELNPDDAPAKKLLEKLEQAK